jgi:hypothetical protein
MSGAIAGQVKLEAASTAFKALSEQIFGGAKEAIYGSFTWTLPCDGEYFEVDALGPNPAVREIVGSRKWASLRAYVNRVRVKKWGPDGLPMSILKIKADRLGLVEKQLAAYLRSVENFYEKPVTDFLLSNPTGLDGVALLHDSHPYAPDGGTWDNKTTDTLSPASFATGIAAMESLQLENEEPAGYFPNILMVGPSNRKLAEDLCNNPMRVVPVSADGVEAYSSALAATAIPNQWIVGKITPVINPRFVGSHASDWLLMDTRREEARPIIVGEAIAPAGYAVTNPESEGMVDRSEARFYVEGFGALMGGNPYSIYGRLS